MIKSYGFFWQVSDFVAQNNNLFLKLLYFSKRFELNFEKAQSALRKIQKSTHSKPFIWLGLASNELAHANWEVFALPSSLSAFAEMSDWAQCKTNDNEMIVRLSPHENCLHF